MGDTCETKSRGHNPRPTAHLQSHREPGLQGQALSPEPWLATFAEAYSSTMPLSHEQDGNKVYIGTQGHERHSGPVPPQQGVGCWSRVMASMSQSHIWLYLSPYRSHHNTRGQGPPDILLQGCLNPAYGDLHAHPASLHLDGAWPCPYGPELRTLATGWAYYPVGGLLHCCAQDSPGGTQCILGKVSLAWQWGQHEL